MNEVFAAPASGLPSLLTALASQDASWAKAEPAAKVARMATRNIRFMGVSLKEKCSNWSVESGRDQAFSGQTRAINNAGRGLPFIVQSGSGRSIQKILEIGADAYRFGIGDW